MHWIGKASDDLANEVTVPPSVLATYVGTYVEQAPFWRSAQLAGSSSAAGRTLVIAVDGGRLVGNMDERGEQVLLATSRTEFTGLYGLGVQFIDGGLLVKHVSGNYRFARK